MNKKLTTLNMQDLKWGNGQKRKKKKQRVVVKDFK